MMIASSCIQHPDLTSDPIVSTSLCSMGSPNYETAGVVSCGVATVHPCASLLSCRAVMGILPMDGGRLR